MEMILCNSKQASLVATRFKKQSFKTIGESLDDMVGPETTRCVSGRPIIKSNMKEKA
jgi:hypothetical protein